MNPNHPSQPSRRRFLRNAGALAGTLALPVQWLPEKNEGQPPETVLLTVRESRSGHTVSPQLIGLSYETSQMQDPGFFSVRNEALVACLRNLNPDGVLRIGGNSSDFAVWSEYRGPLPPYLDGPHGTHPHTHIITPGQLEDLAGFLRATGWRLIFGLNLRADLPHMAAELAETVQRTVGKALLAIQIGNEPDDDVSANHLRFDFETYFERWQRTTAAVRQRVAVPLAGPDVSDQADWVVSFAEHARDIVALSRHYYSGGAHAPTSTLTQLLAGDPGFIHQTFGVLEATRFRHLPLILSEANSYWDGGKPGISNTFASALWGGDFALACAQVGVHSINFHGGVLQVLENALSESVSAGSSQGSRFDRIDAISGYYTPIAGDVKTGFYARPLYYGMQLARQFSGARFMDCELSRGNVNLTAYAATHNGKRIMAVFNKDLQRDADVRVMLDEPARSAREWRLWAPGIGDIHDTRFGGKQVGFDGHWTPTPGLPLQDVDTGFWLRVPHASATFVRLDV